MKKLNQLHFFLLLFSISAFTACKKQSQENNLPKEELLFISERVNVPELDNNSLLTNRSNNDYNTFYGPTVQMGNGHARSWINITRESNKPLAIGIEFTEAAFENLPDNPVNPADNFFALKVHQKAKDLTPFDHIGINWEEHGHPPPGIYTVPHFDLHFYKISLSEQMAITGVPGLAPSSGYLPAAYVIRGATVPQMGTHWLNPASPELAHVNPAPFTHTFIYGSNNGHVHFLEPMITNEFLLKVNGVGVHQSFPQPDNVLPTNKYYPTYYRIWKNSENKRRYVALSDFVWRRK